MTPRDRRVPANDPAATTHPNGARGVAELRVLADDIDGEAIAPLKRLFDEILPAVAGEKNTWQLSMARKSDEADMPPSCQIKIDDAKSSGVANALKRRSLVARVQLHGGNGKLIPLEIEAPDDPR